MQQRICQNSDWFELLLIELPLWCNSPKRPSPISDHYIFTFWEVAYEGFDSMCKV